MNASYKGLTIFFLVLALISISLAILNLFPLPILDGGQMLFYTIEAIIHRPLSESTMNSIRIINWLLFLGLAIILSAHDIYRIISPYIGQIATYLGFGS
jgi:regulator of sigma E protease